jgi:CheY-like chemotaxis protein
VRVESEAETADAVRLHFSVIDTGVGIAPEKRQLIFQAFEQADTSTTRIYGGTGLGLSISSKLVEMMNGRIWVESELGRGSEFHFTAQFDLPKSNAMPATGDRKSNATARRQAATAVSDPQNPLNALGKLQILLAEDNLVNQRVIAGLLEKRGHALTIANNGREAFEAAERNRFDVILMDVQMPEVSGLEATVAIRQWEQRLGIHTPIIALTALAMKGDEETCLAAGMDGYLTKPIQPRELLSAIANVLLTANAVPVSGAPLDKQPQGIAAASV